MAIETVSNALNGPRALPGALADARERTVQRAALEVGAIAGMLQRESVSLTACADDFKLLLPSALMRIEALSSAMSILTSYGSDREADIADQYAVVFGKPLEVTHG